MLECQLVRSFLLQPDYSVIQIESQTLPCEFMIVCIVIDTEHWSVWITAYFCYSYVDWLQETVQTPMKTDQIGQKQVSNLYLAA